MSDLETDICAIAETHVSMGEVDGLSFKGFGAQAKSCRSDSPNGGGVILVRAGIDSGDVTDMPSFPAFLSVCSAAALPNEYA